MQIRNAELKDAEQVAEVLISFYRMKDKNEARGAFLSEADKGHHYIIAHEGKKILGVVSWLVHGLPKHGLAELDRICVLPESKGKGIGKKLVDALIRDAEIHFKNEGSKLRKLYLLTHADNKDAQAFYEKAGFKHETTLKRHYYCERDEFLYSMFFN